MPAFPTDELWVIVTSNNLSSYDLVFTSREEADKECATRIAARFKNRTDHLVADLEDAIREQISDAEFSAMSDG